MRQKLCLLTFLAFCTPITAQADGLLLTYKVDSTRTMDVPAAETGTAQRTESKDTAPQSNHQETKVYLYPDYIVFDSGARLERFDFASKEDTTYITADKVFYTVPLATHAISDAREKINRLQMAQAVSATPGLADKFYTGNKDVFAVDIDTMLGALGDKNLSELPAPTVDGAKASYALNGKPISDITYSDKTVPDTLKKAYVRFLAYGPTLHPRLEKTIAGNGHLLASSYTVSRDTGWTTSSSWTLQSAETVSGDVPAPPPEGYTQRFTGDDALDNAIAAGASTPAPTIAAHEARVKDFMAKNDQLRATLDILQATLELGKPALQQSPALTSALRTTAASAGIKLLLTAVAVPVQNAEDLVRVTTIFASAKTAAPEYILLLDVFRARQARVFYSGKQSYMQDDVLALQEANHQLAAGIIANPKLVGVYCDLALSYFNRYDTNPAFALWKQAQRLQPDFPSLAQVRAMEQQAESDFPEYF